MRDPHDNSTLDLVEEAKRQKLREQNARRQERLRTKRRIERQEGKRIGLEFTAEELMLLCAVSGAEAQKAAEQHPESWRDRSYNSLWRRLVKAQTGRDAPGDARWSREALAADAAEVRAALEQLLVGIKPAVSVAQAAPVGDGERDYRLTEHEVAVLLWCIDDHLTIRSDLHTMDTWGFRELVEKLAGSRWRGFVEMAGKSEGVLNILERHKSEARRWQQSYKELFEQHRKNSEKDEAITAQRRAAEFGPLQRELEALRREKDLLEAERNRAFAANKVFEQRLRDAGLSTDYR